MGQNVQATGPAFARGLMTPRARLALGAALLGVGLVLPFASFLVLAADWPGVVKSAVAGILLFGPEIMAIPAVAIMGKENFDRIVATVKRWAGTMKPAGNIGPTRHLIGLILFFVPALPTYIMAYLPAWLPDGSPARLWVNVLADVLFLASLFVLGGDFWDKLRALLTREARASVSVNAQQ